MLNVSPTLAKADNKHIGKTLNLRFICGHQNLANSGPSAR